MRESCHLREVLIVLLCVVVGGTGNGRIPDGPIVRWIKATDFIGNMVTNVERKGKSPQGFTVVTSTDLQSLSQVSVLDMVTGEKHWNAPTGGAGIRVPVVLDDIICTVAGTSPCRLRCYPVTSSTQMWSWEQPGGDSLSGATVSTKLQLFFLVSVNSESTSSTSYAVKHSSDGAGAIVWSCQHNYTKYAKSYPEIPPTPTYDPITGMKFNIHFV